MRGRPTLPKHELVSSLAQTLIDLSLDDVVLRQLVKLTLQTIKQRTREASTFSMSMRSNNGGPGYDDPTSTRDPGRSRRLRFPDAPACGPSLVERCLVEVDQRIPEQPAMLDLLRLRLTTTELLEIRAPALQDHPPQSDSAAPASQRGSSGELMEHEVSPEPPYRPAQNIALIRWVQSRDGWNTERAHGTHVRHSNSEWVIATPCGQKTSYPRPEWTSYRP